MRTLFFDSPPEAFFLSYLATFPSSDHRGKVSLSTTTGWEEERGRCFKLPRKRDLSHQRQLQRGVIPRHAPLRDKLHLGRSLCPSSPLRQRYNPLLNQCW